MARKKVQCQHIHEDKVCKMALLNPVSLIEPNLRIMKPM